MRGIFLAICGAAALAAVGGASAWSQVRVRTVAPGGAYVYKNLGCEYRAGTAATPAPTIYCGEWNFRQLVPGSYVFAATPGWGFLLRATPTGLTQLQSFQQPDATGPAPAIFLGKLGPILAEHNLFHAVYSDQFRFDGTSLLANDLKTADGTGPLAGLIDLDASGAAANHSFLGIWSRQSLGVQQYTAGAGTQTVVEHAQPKPGPDLDAIGKAVARAKAAEDRAAADLRNGSGAAARIEIASSIASLDKALREIGFASRIGEARLDEWEGLRLRLITARADDGAARKAKTREAALQELRNADGEKYYVLISVPARKKALLALK